MKKTGMSTFAATAALMVAMAQPGMADGVAASSYVQNGLVACWDGIENAGAGTHDADATVWKDIVGGYEFALTGVTVDADRMTFAGDATSYGILSSNDTVSTFVAAKNGTMEIVYAARTSPGNKAQVMLQSSDSAGMAFGMNGTSALLPNTSSKNSSRPKYAFDSSLVTATNSVAVRYSGGISASAIANGSVASSSGSDYWWYPEWETYIGIRSNKSAFFPGSIYCIRLYSRQLTDAEIAVNQSVDKLRFMLDADTALMVTGNQDSLGAPSPAYGVVADLAAGDTLEVSCGEPVCTNAAGSAEYRCSGWMLYDMNDSVISRGAGTSFTYTHPTPAAFRRLEWQWEVSRRFTDFSDFLGGGHGQAQLIQPILTDVGGVARILGAAAGQESILHAVNVAHVGNHADILLDVGTHGRIGLGQVGQTALGREVHEHLLTIVEDDVGGFAAGHHGGHLVAGAGAGNGDVLSLDAQGGDLLVDPLGHLVVLDRAARGRVAAIPQHDTDGGGAFCHGGNHADHHDGGQQQNSNDLLEVVHGVFLLFCL